MMTVSSFRDLRVWRAGVTLVEDVYKLTQSFPSHETYGLTSQMRRAAVSVPSNIAEGHTREHTREYLHHLSIAQASLAELQTQVEIAGRLRYLPAESVTHLLDEAAGLSKQLFALRNGLLRRLREPPFSPPPIP